MNKRITLATFIAALLLVAGAAEAQRQEGDWMVRARAINIIPDHKSDAAPAVPAGADAITLNNVVAPEVDISYFLTKNWALELILTVPQKHDVRLNGANIGTAKHLPPTLTVQYHFLPDGKFRPYVGAGLNYTKFSSVNIAGGTLTLDDSSTGGALQAGVDIRLTGKVFLNFDVKKIWIGTDLKLAATGAKVSHLDLNPWVLGIGVGWRF